MKVLVSGGAGYIGSHAVVQLLDKQYDVVVVDNLSTGHQWAVDKRASFYQCDIRNKKDLDKVFNKEKIDVVMQFAADIVVAESEQDRSSERPANTPTPARGLCSSKARPTATTATPRATLRFTGPRRR